MNIIEDFIVKIPKWIDAREPEQFQDELVTAYKRDSEGLTNVYDRDKNRFFIIKKQPVKSLKGYFAKRHILNLLDIMNKKHKPNLLTVKDKRKLEKQISMADKSMSARSTTTGTQRAANTWSI